MKTVEELFHYCATILLTSILLFTKKHCIGQRLEDILIKSYLPEDGRLNFTQLTNKYGRSVEQFDVVTEDGYILTLFHIIPNQNFFKRPPVLLQHGNANSGDDYVLRGYKSLAITLANAGYDVWIGNTRGNKYGRRHKVLDPDRDTEFWNYSLHETGLYDAPAIVDYVLNKTGNAQLTAIGHSQGNTLFYVLGSLKPEYNNKINVVIALGAVAFLHNWEPPMTTVVQLAPLINEIFLTFKQEELLPEFAASKLFVEILCSRQVLSYEICLQGAMFALAGADNTEIEREFLPVIIGHYPQGSTRKTLMHVFQISKNKRFAQYDYGPSENLLRYNSEMPPQYDLSKVTMKVALLVGKNDKFSTVKDSELLRDRLPNVVDYQVLKPALWNHMDWVWARRMDKYLFPYIFVILEKYS